MGKKQGKHGKHMEQHMEQENDDLFFLEKKQWKKEGTVSWRFSELSLASSGPSP